MRIRLFSMALLLLPVSAAAQDTTKKKPDPNRMICRTEEVIGSRLMTERHCMTAQQWIDLRLETRRAVERVQRLEFKGG